MIEAARTPILLLDEDEPEGVAEVVDPGTVVLTCANCGAPRRTDGLAFCADCGLPYGAQRT